MNGKRPCKSNRPKERATILDDFDHCVIKRTINSLYSRKKRQTTFLQTFGIPEISQTFYPFYKKMQNITIIYERNACQGRLISKENATKPIVSFDRVYQKTSKALGVSYTSVHHIMNGKRPCKSNRPKERAKILHLSLIIDT
jgi:hypothetical protein